MLEARAFEPEYLRKLDRLVLGIKRARTVRAGQRAVGRVLGLGIEPEDFKQYALGDDLRFLDWNAFARLDELLIRTFRAERQVEITALIDASASMGLPRGDDKLGLALAMGASLAYIAMAENDPVRLSAYSMRRGALKMESTPLRRRRETYPELRPFVEGIRASGKALLAEAVDQFLLERRPAGIVIVISDFLASESEIEIALKRLVASRHEVKVVHVMGEAESAGAYPPGLYRIRDSETGEVREAVLGPETATACRARVERLAEAIGAICAHLGIAYARAFGASTLDHFMEREMPLLGIVR
jgi:uncharacterized protein (DUF58 family)